MKVFITGGTGFLGKALTDGLIAGGHQVTILTRSARNRNSPAGVAYAEGNPNMGGTWQKEITGHDAVINLAGASIFRRWTPGNKKLIYRSRIDTTRNLADAIQEHADRKVVLLNGSAVGYYGFSEDEELDENSPPGDDFLAHVVKDWEAEARKAESADCRVVLCRIGVILGKDGGALSKMLSAFRLGLGSPLGSGNQWFSWICLPDLVEIFLYLLQDETISGPVNCTSPNPVTNREMTRVLGKALHRPVFLPAVPSFVLRTALGEFSEVFVRGQKVLPGKLMKKGFTFKYAGIEKAFASLV